MCLVLLPPPLTPYSLTPFLTVAVQACAEQKARTRRIAHLANESRLQWQHHLCLVEHFYSIFYPLAWDQLCVTYANLNPTSQATKWGLATKGVRGENDRVEVMAQRYELLDKRFRALQVGQHSGQRSVAFPHPMHIYRNCIRTRRRRWIVEHTSSR